MLLLRTGLTRRLGAAANNLMLDLEKAWGQILS